MRISDWSSDVCSSDLKMARRRQIYEGKAKILYEGPEPGTLIQYFKDDATAFNAQKKGTISGKGVLNNRISEHIFTLLGHIGVPTHRSEEHTSELQSLMRISYAVFCLTKKNSYQPTTETNK